MIYRTVWIVILSLLCKIAFAQDDYSSVRSISDVDYIINMKLPSLDELLVAVEKNPSVLESDYMIKYSEREKKSRAREWLNYFAFNASYNYGVTNNYFMYRQTNVPVADTYSQNSQDYYFVGGGINLPLYHIVNFSNRVKQQKLYTEAQKQIRDRKIDEIKVQVIASYFDAQAELSLLPHIIENMQLAQSQYDEAKLNFINGKIDKAVLNDMKTNQYKIVQEFQKSITTLKRSLYYLEVYTHKKIINR